MARLLDGKACSAVVREEVRLEVQQLQRADNHNREPLLDRPPGLAVVVVGARPDSATYVRNKTKACLECGFHVEDHHLDEEGCLLELDQTQTPPQGQKVRAVEQQQQVEQELHPQDNDLLHDQEQDEGGSSAQRCERRLIRLVRALNADEKIDGILVQLPLPDGVDASRVLAEIQVDKDVDGFLPHNLGCLALKGGHQDPFAKCCTPAGVLELLKRNGIQIAGKKAVVLGRSNIVGVPLSLLLLHEDATVTVCHSKTLNLEEECKQADILCCAMGKAEFVPGSFVKRGAVVVDIGINSVDAPECKRGYRLTGDVRFEEAKEKAAWITPVPGGVGPMTIAMLLRNTLDLCKKRNGIAGDGGRFSPTGAVAHGEEEAAAGAQGQPKVVSRAKRSKWRKSDSTEDFAEAQAQSLVRTYTSMKLGEQAQDVEPDVTKAGSGATSKDINLALATTSATSSKPRAITHQGSAILDKFDDQEAPLLVDEAPTIVRKKTKFDAQGRAVLFTDMHRFVHFRKYDKVALFKRNKPAQGPESADRDYVPKLHRMHSVIVEGKWVNGIVVETTDSHVKLKLGSHGSGDLRWVPKNSANLLPTKLFVPSLQVNSRKRIHEAEKTFVKKQATEEAMRTGKQTAQLLAERVEAEHAENAPAKHGRYEVEVDGLWREIGNRQCLMQHARELLLAGEFLRFPGVEFATAAGANPVAPATLEYILVPPRDHYGGKKGSSSSSIAGDADQHGSAASADGEVEDDTTAMLSSHCDFLINPPPGQRLKRKLRALGQLIGPPVGGGGGNKGNKQPLNYAITEQTGGAGAPSTAVALFGSKLSDTLVPLAEDVVDNIMYSSQNSHMTSTQLSTHNTAQHRRVLDRARVRHQNQLTALKKKQMGISVTDAFTRWDEMPFYVTVRPSFSGNMDEVSELVQNYRAQDKKMFDAEEAAKKSTVAKVQRQVSKAGKFLFPESPPPPRPPPPVVFLEDIVKEKTSAGCWLKLKTHWYVEDVASPPMKTSDRGAGAEKGADVTVKTTTTIEVTVTQKTEVVAGAGDEEGAEDGKKPEDGGEAAADAEKKPPEPAPEDPSAEQKPREDEAAPAEQAKQGDGAEAAETPDAGEAPEGGGEKMKTEGEDGDAAGVPAASAEGAEEYVEEDRGGGGGDDELAVGGAGEKDEQLGSEEAAEEDVANEQDFDDEIAKNIKRLAAEQELKRQEEEAKQREQEERERMEGVNNELKGVYYFCLVTGEYSWTRPRKFSDPRIEAFTQRFLKSVYSEPENRDEIFRLRTSIREKAMPLEIRDGQNLAIIQRLYAGECPYEFNHGENLKNKQFRTISADVEEAEGLFALPLTKLADRHPSEPIVLPHAVIEPHEWVVDHKGMRTGRGGMTTVPYETITSMETTYGGKFLRDAMKRGTLGDEFGENYDGRFHPPGDVMGTRRSETAASSSSAEVALPAGQLSPAQLAQYPSDGKPRPSPALFRKKLRKTAPGKFHQTVDQAYETLFGGEDGLAPKIHTLFGDQETKDRSVVPLFGGSMSLSTASASSPSPKGGATAATRKKNFTYDPNSVPEYGLNQHPRQIATNRVKKFDFRRASNESMSESATKYQQDATGKFGKRKKGEPPLHQFLRSQTKHLHRSLTEVGVGIPPSLDAGALIDLNNQFEAEEDEWAFGEHDGQTGVEMKRERLSQSQRVQPGGRGRFARSDTSMSALQASLPVGTSAGNLLGRDGAAAPGAGGGPGAIMSQSMSMAEFNRQFEKVQEFERGGGEASPAGQMTGTQTSFHSGANMGAAQRDSEMSRSQGSFYQRQAPKGTVLAMSQTGETTQTEFAYKRVVRQWGYPTDPIPMGESSVTEENQIKSYNERFGFQRIGRTSTGTVEYEWHTLYKRPKDNPLHAKMR
eukprot:g10152.t1